MELTLLALVQDSHCGFKLRGVAGEGGFEPGQLPDGFLLADLEGIPGETGFVVEIATYPERRLEEQLWRDAHLVELARRVRGALLDETGVRMDVTLRPPRGLARSEGKAVRVLDLRNH